MASAIRRLSRFAEDGAYLHCYRGDFSVCAISIKPGLTYYEASAAGSVQRDTVHQLEGTCVSEGTHDAEKLFDGKPTVGLVSAQDALATLRAEFLRQVCHSPCIIHLVSVSDARNRGQSCLQDSIV